MGEDNLSILKRLCAEINVSLLKRIEEYELNLFGKTKQKGLFPIVVLEVTHRYHTGLIMNVFQVKKRCLSQRNRGAAQEALKVMETLRKLMLRFFLLFFSFWTLYTTCISILYTGVSLKSDQVSSYLLTDHNTFYSLLIDYLVVCS